MQDSFGIIMLAIVDQRPQLLTLREMLAYFLEHRKEIITRATAFDLRKAEARLHILDGLKIAAEAVEQFEEHLLFVLVPGTTVDEPVELFLVDAH